MQRKPTILGFVTAPLRWALGGLRRALRNIAWRMLHDASEYRDVRLLIHFRAPDGSLGRIKAALDRIADIDPITFAKIPRFLPGGIVADAANYSTAWYSVQRKACVIGPTALQSYDLDDIALCIVHELCHARLFAAGFGYDGAQFRTRIEKICIRREIGFARKLEDRDVKDGFYSDWLAEKLTEIKPENYSEESFRKRQRLAFLKKLRLLKQINTPHCLRRRIVMKARRRFQRQRQIADDLGNAVRTDATKS
ncbi:hypothetical protein [Roseovarius phycicola]|uniref:SprT-like domain-containing protein n=1 Tax=Roseovarius phycicola TaxID=3080976 RepID=A0ABZ2HHA5_9RHOB